MKIDIGRLRRPALWLGLPLLGWSTYWATVIWSDVRTETALGQDTALRDFAAHDAFQLLFVAAHGGVRWMSGVAALALVGLAFFLWRRRPERRVHRDREPSAVTGG